MEPECIDCPICDGRGCKECQDRGQIILTECPYENYITSDIRELVMLAGLHRKGSPPVAGGTLDQANWYMEATNVLWRDQDTLVPKRDG